VMEVASLVGDVLLRPGRRLHRFGAAVAPLLAARYSAQAAAQVRFRVAILARVEDGLPIGERGEGLHAHVDARLLRVSCASLARLLPGGGQRMRRHISARECYAPAASLV
jgi:hypothetical protein